MNRGLSEEALAAARELFAEALRQHGARAASDLAADAVVVLEGLFAAAAPGATSVDTHEVLALATLLGRRLSVAGASTAALLVVADRLAEERGAVAEGVLRLALVDGYVEGTRERTEADVEERVLRTVDAHLIGPQVLFVVVPQLLDEARMIRAIDAVGRTLLSRDAKACVAVVAAGDGMLRDAVVSGALQLLEHVRMVGAKVAFAVAEPGLRGALERRLEGSASVSGDVVAALASLELEVAPKGVLRRWLSR